MSLRTVLIILIALSGLSYGGVKAYVYYNIMDVADRMVLGLSPHAKVEYGGISSTLEGMASIDDISIVIHQTGDVIAIDSLQLNAPDVRFFLGKSDNLAAAKAPQQLGIKVNGLDFDLKSQYAGDFDYMLRKHTEENGITDIGCGDVAYIGPYALQDIGYSRLVLDFSFQYGFDPENTALNIDFSMSAKDMFSMTMDMSMVMGVKSISATNARMISPHLSSLDALYRDESYIGRVNNYCAEKAGVSVDEFIKTNMKASAKEMKQSGLVLEKVMMQEIASFMKNPGELAITAHPLEPVEMKTLHLYNPSDIPALINLAIESR